MRKWLIGALLAATAGLPALAQAQDAVEEPAYQRGGGERGDGSQRAERPARAERQEERQEQRAERQAQRAERQAQRVDPVEQPPVTVAQPRERGNDMGLFQARDPRVEARAESTRRERRDGNVMIAQPGVEDFGAAAARRDQQVERIRRGDWRGVERNDTPVVRLDRRNPSYDPARGDRPERQEARRDDRRDDRAERREDRHEDRREDRRDDRARIDRNGSDNGWGGQNGWTGRDGWNGQNGWSGRDGWNGGNARYGWNDRDRGNRNWSRDWRRDGRYDWNGYRSGNRNAFRLPRYYAPYGWNYGYRRFSIGVSLSSVLWGRNYWINDPWAYRLPEAYGPYRWVRYYSDAVLVDIRSGQIVDVIHGIFY